MQLNQRVWQQSNALVKPSRRKEMDMKQKIRSQWFWIAVIGGTHNCFGRDYYGITKPRLETAAQVSREHAHQEK